VSLLLVGEVRSIVLLLLLPPLLPLLPLRPWLRRLTLGVSDVRSMDSETGRFLDMPHHAAARAKEGGATENAWIIRVVGERPRSFREFYRLVER
jgi:hypothetical protein